MKKQGLYAIIFVFIMTMLFIRSIYLKSQDINGSVGYDRFSVRLKGDSLIENAFDVHDVDELEKALDPELMTCYAFEKGLVAWEKFGREAVICGIKGDFNEFYNMRVKRGSFLNEIDYDNESYVAVLDEELAASIFGSDDIIGLDVEIYDKKFKVIGITGNDTSIAGRIIEKDLPYAYIPLSTMDDVNGSYSIANIELKAEKGSLDRSVIEDKIALTGRNTGDFYIEDWNSIGIISRQRFDILLFITGIHLIWNLLLVIYDISGKFIALIKSYLKENYFSDVIKIIWVKFLIALGKTAGILTSIIFIWKEISFDLYILPERFPEDPTSISEILGIGKKALMETIRTDYSYMHHNNLIISFLNKQGSMIFLVALICEIYILFFMLKNIRAHYGSMLEAVKGLGLCYAVSILLSHIVIYSMGLPVELPIKSMILLWAGFFTIAVVKGSKFVESESVGVKNEQGCA